MVIYTVTEIVYPIILLIFYFAPFFLSLLHLQNQLKLLLSLIIFFFLWYTQTHPHEHTHTDKPTQRSTKTHGPFDACGLVLQWRLKLAKGGDPLKQNAKPTFSHCLTELARAPPPKHRSHHPPHTIQPSPPSPVKTTTITKTR